MGESSPPRSASQSPLALTVATVVAGGLIGAATVVGVVATTTGPHPLRTTDAGAPPGSGPPDPSSGIEVRIPLGSEVGSDWLCLDPGPRDSERTCLVPQQTEARDLLDTGEAQELLDVEMKALRDEMDLRFDDQEQRYERALGREREGEGLSALELLQALVVIVGGIVGMICTVLTVLSVRHGWGPTVGAWWQRLTRRLRRRPRLGSGTGP